MSAPPARQSAVRVAAWAVVTLFGVGLVAYAVGYFTLSEAPFVVQRRAFAELRPILLTHIGCGAAAILLGPWQFLAPLRRRALLLHRALGGLYAASAMGGAVTGLILAPHAYGGATTSVGFGLLSLLWAIATAFGAAAALSRDFVRHRAWMMRSYAMTFAALTLRAELGILIFWFGLPLIEAYRVSTWSSWVVNLLFVEWALLASARPKTDATRRRAPTGDTGGESVLNGKIKPQTSMGQRPRPVWR